MTQPIPMIHAAMKAVAAEISKLGITKSRKASTGGNFNYRGVDDVLDDFTGPLLKAGLTVSPSYDIVEHKPNLDKDGKKNGYIAIVKGTLTFYADDGSSRVCGPFPGEGYDSLDKSMSKATSVAYRNGMLLTFVVPLGPGYDPEESDDDEVEPQKAAEDLPLAERGIHLTDTQRDWLGKKLKQYRCTEAEMLKNWPRVDANNVEAVVAWMKA